MRVIEKEFLNLIRDIVKTEEFRRMKGYRHHVKGNVYYHSLKVAYFCYKYAKRHKTKATIYELVRGALLHDYYLYDWHNMEHKLHLLTHPKSACENALRDYPDLTKNEIDMIKHHMFPLIVIPPKTRHGWIVCYYDKKAALSDYFGKNKWKPRKFFQN